MKHDTHRLGVVFGTGQQFTAPCSCGQKFTAATPTDAMTLQKRHNTTERVRLCGCGCGERLSPTSKGIFRLGHDVRFKSILIRAHAQQQLVRHPETEHNVSALNVADFLDRRRGGGDFWRTKILGGSKTVSTGNTDMGHIGYVALRSGNNVRAVITSVLDNDALQVKFVDGPQSGQTIITGRHRFKKDVTAS